MNDSNEKSPPATGLRRFHKLTIGAGLVFLLILAVHYWRRHEASGEARDLAYGGVALGLALVLGLYLRSFSRSRALG